jgi:hypothetical protein
VQLLILRQAQLQDVVEAVDIWKVLRLLEGALTPHFETLNVQHILVHSPLVSTTNFQMLQGTFFHSLRVSRHNQK